MIEQLVNFIREQYRTNGDIPLHAPVFRGREREYLLDTVDTTYVSSIGSYVDCFERDVAQFVGSPSAVAVVNGTAALHIALKLAGVKENDFVITQALTFIATCNAIAYCGASPLFIDVDLRTLGLSPKALEEWLSENAFLNDEGVCFAKNVNRRISACVPMHTFGHPVDVDALIIVCKKWNLAIVEDAAESLGSFYKGRHTGTFGLIGTLSFNGNKILTTGGGGMLLTDHKTAKQAKHITTTAKIPHRYEFIHDDIAYNYRLPNLNAAMGCAQIEQLDEFLVSKRLLAKRYIEFFSHSNLTPIVEPSDCRSNYWLNGVICEDRRERDFILNATNSQGIMTRPIWTLMTRLPMFKASISGQLVNSLWLEDRVINLPSSVLPD